MRVLHIEADGAVARAVELMLRSEGMQVVATEEGGDGADLAGLYEYDIVLLDLDLGDMPGLDVLRHIRRAKIHTPVLVLTGDSSVDTKVRALNAGADDYLTKPFHKDELVARIHAVIRRAKGHAASTIGIGLLSVDLDRKVVEVDGVPVLLTGKEYQILEVLALRRGSVITKDAILDYLYGGRDEPELKIVDVFVCKLRKKLREAGAGEVIQTEWGRGYALRAPTPGAEAA